MKKTHLSLFWRAALLLCAFFTLLQFTALAEPRQWGEDGIPIRQGLHIEWQRACYRNSAGYVLVVWSDTRWGDRDVYGQLINPNGQEMWDVGGKAIIRGYEFRQEDPDIAATSDNAWIVAWIDYRVDSTGDIYAQKLDMSGNQLWDSQGVMVDQLPGSVVNELSCRVVSDGAGGGIVAWEDQRHDPGDIYAQRILANGTRGWANPLAVTDTAGTQIGITADADGNGNMLVAWNDSRNPTDANIYAAKITPAGTTPWGANGVLVCGRTGEQKSVKICNDGQGGCYLGWQDRGSGASNNLWIQHLNGNGQFFSANWVQDGIILCGAVQDQADVRVAPSDSFGVNTGCITVWEDQRVDAFTNEVYAQKVTANGVMQWAVDGIKVIGDAGDSSGSHSRDGVRLSSDAQGGLICAWEDTRSDEKADIYANRILPNGTMAWGATGVPVVIAPKLQFAPVLRADAGDGMFVFWSDKRLGSQSLRYQNLNIATGERTLPIDGVEMIYGLDGDALEPRMVDMTMGRVGIVWSDNRLTDNGPMLYYQVIDTLKHIERALNGDPISPVNLSENNANQKNHRICPDGSGGLFVCYEDQRANAKLIRVSHVNVAGIMDVDSQGVIVWQSALDQSDAYVTSDGIGGCYVGWSGYNSELLIDVFLMRVNANCQPQWTQPVQLFNGENDNILKGLATSEDGCCMMVWKSGPSGQFDVSSARVCRDGNVAWNIAVCNAAGVQDNATLISDGQNGAYFAWSDNRDLNNSKDIFAQHIDAAGTATWNANGLIVCTFPLLQDKPVLKMDLSGHIYCLWEDFRTGIQLDLYGQKLTSTGARLWPDSGRVICNTEGDQKEICPLIEWWNGLYLTWTDNRNFYPDIYAAHFDSTGVLRAPYWQANSGGIICDFYQKQQKSAMAADGHGASIAAWEDYRASGKEPLVNIWANWVNDFTVKITEIGNGLIPKTHELAQNYPNPFNPSTEIAFSIPQTEKVEILVYNTLGQQVAKLADKVMTAGSYRLSFSVNNVASGVYFYELRTPTFQQVKKMTLLK